MRREKIVDAAAIERIPNTGDLLCLWNEGPKDKRLGLSKYTIAVSGDEGKTCTAAMLAIEMRPRRSGAIRASSVSR